VGYAYEASAGNIRLLLTNRGASMSKVSVANAYDDGDEKTFMLKPGATAESLWVLDESHGWYDLSVTTSAQDGFLRRLAGHVETGRSSFTDPALGMG
jgi:phospholipase C